MRLTWIIALICFSEACFAFRCGNKLVEIGDTRYEVNAICGAPDDVTSNSVFRSITNGAVVECDPVRSRSVDSLDAAAPRSCLALVEDQLAVRIDVDVWLYDFGKNRFMQRVHFENGLVTHIEKLGYGVKPRRSGLRPWRVVIPRALSACPDPPRRPAT